MRICLLYVCVTRSRRSAEFASRFAASYQLNPPGWDHDTVVVCNGGPLALESSLIFSALKPKYWPRKNDGGWDISAYIEASHTLCKDYDMLMLCGESAYFHRPGWLKRFVEAWEKWGPGFYGTFSSYLIHPHLQTNGFCCSPGLLQSWTDPVLNREQRYAFEHGTNALWRRAAVAMLVTWDGEYMRRFWRHPPNILWRGDQSNCLLWNNHTDHWFRSDPGTRATWSNHADFGLNEANHSLHLSSV